MSVNVIAIDGPAASGKSTAASHLAGLLSFLHINTGSMFRAVSYLILQNHLELNDIDGIKKLLNSITMEYRPGADGTFELYVNNIKLDNELRSPEVTKIVSPVATIKAVRDYLKAIQRKIAEGQTIIMEGRDIGSVVFPDAKWKFFITASPEVRARRRLEQDKIPYTPEQLKQVADSIAERDRIDSTRQIAPLIQCPDAVKINTDNMTIDEVVNFMADIVKTK